MKKDYDLLEKWELKAKNLPVTIWSPLGYFKEYEKKRNPC